MVATTARAPYRFTPDQRRRMAEIGISPDDAHRFTFDEYVQLWREGVFGPEERVELIEGECIEMGGAEAPHANAVRRLTLLLARMIPDGYALDVQNPIRLSTDGAPQPDLAVVYDREYDALPAEADVLLLIEVSHATLRYDRGHKLRMYARAGIPEVWIVNVEAREIERHTAPHGDTYTNRVTARSGEILPSTTVNGVVIPVADVLR